MGIKESALAVLTAVADTDFVRVVTAAGASRRILVPNMLPIEKGANGHNSIFRGKSLGSSISTAQNQAIKDRTYTDLYVGDYWTIGGVNYRIAAIEYYINCGDSTFGAGHLIVVPDSQLYTYAMNPTNDTTGGYANSDMRENGLAQARTIITAAFGNHLKSHRVIMTNATASGKPSGWAWMDSDGIELMNEQQVCGAPAWRDAAQNGFDVGTQKLQFPLFLYAPRLVNTRQNYWLQDVGSASTFALVASAGRATDVGASSAFGVRPAITLSYI